MLGKNLHLEMQDQAKTGATAANSLPGVCGTSRNVHGPWVLLAIEHSNPTGSIISPQMLITGVKELLMLAQSREVLA